MTTDTELESSISYWLEDGPTEPAAWAVDAAIESAIALPRRRHRKGALAMSLPLRIGAIAAVLVLAVLGVSRLIGGSPSQPGQVAPSASPSASPSANPLGALVPHEWEGQVPVNGVGAATGRWTLLFTPAQLLYRNSLGGNISQHITYQGADEFTLAEDADCQGASGVGRYRWSVTGSALTITPIAEGSPCREAVFAAPGWTRVDAP
jgi:hypothetical protein